MKQRHGNGNGMGTPLSMAVQLLPTPTAMDAHSSGGNSPANVTLTDAVVRTSLGASTNPRFAVGSESPDVLPLDPPSEADEATSD